MSKVISVSNGTPLFFTPFCAVRLNLCYFYENDFMSKSSKIALGIVSFMPLILSGAILIMVFSMFPEIMEWDKHEPSFREVFSTFAPIIITAIFTGLISFGLLIYYIIQLVNNKQIETAEKIIWFFVFFCAGAIGYPIFWFMRVWNEKDPERI